MLCLIWAGRHYVWAGRRYVMRHYVMVQKALFDVPKGVMLCAGRRYVKGRKAVVMWTGRSTRFFNFFRLVDHLIDDREQSHVTHDYVSLGGSSYWIHVVSYHIKPKINSIFDSYRATLSMYFNYASLAGFDIATHT
uniref:Uncharacterized protein n=1 Tax=Lactuca sativa TaxID=4236 RepID=A0A9R1VP14_LACSA|nr:hypothetical protein LSAT_V11C500240920 [Lactuca sativa]